MPGEQISKVSERKKGWPKLKDKPDLSEMEAPEGYKWFEKSALMLECERCGAWLYVDKVDKHELEEHGEMNIPDETKTHSLESDKVDLLFMTSEDDES